MDATSVAKNNALGHCMGGKEGTIRSRFGEHNSNFENRPGGSDMDFGEKGTNQNIIYETCIMRIERSIVYTFRKLKQIMISKTTYKYTNV